MSTMSLTFNSIRSNKTRFFLTGVAVILGVAFMAGTLVLTDTIKRSYTDVTTSVYQHTDAVVRSRRVVDAGAQNGGKMRGTIAASTLAIVRSARGVGAADARQTGVAVVVGHDGKLVDANPNRPAPIALAWQSAPSLNPMDLVSGHAPRAPGEVVIDRASQRAGHFRVGEQVRVVGPTGPAAYRLVGIVTYAGQDSAAGSQVVAFTPETAARVLGTAGHYTEIQVVAAKGVSQRQLVVALQHALQAHGAHDVEAITGKQAITETKSDTVKSLAFFGIFLMTFAVIAIVVGSFVIYNTFSITMAQRVRETALLRAIGASRKQVKRSIRMEAILTGTVASALGVAVGIAMADGLRAMLRGFGMSLPDGGLVIGSSAIVASLIAGIAVTIVAAAMPARRASKVPPIAALRDVSVDRSGTSKVRAALGVLLTGFGVLGVVSALDQSNGGGVGVGALLAFVGVIVLGPSLARPFARVFGAPLRMRGMAGVLARENVRRNPRRTASTAASLMIGVALIATMTVFAASVKASLASQIDNAVRGDWIVATQYGMGGLPPNVAGRVAALPQTGAVSAMRWTTAKVDGTVDQIAAFDPSHYEDTMSLGVRSGDVHRLGRDGIAVQADVAKTHELHIGSPVNVWFPETGARQLRVVATYTTKQPLGSWVISTVAYDANVRDHVDQVLLVKNAPGVSMHDARVAINRVLADYPTATLRTKAEFSGSVAARINQLLGLIDALLGMAIVIALFGIANTLTLSVFERTREIGLLRAVGASRSQVRSTVRWEAVLIALLGTTLGMGLGLGFGAALVTALHGQGFTVLSMPATQLGLIVVVAAVAAVLTAALPARRAARLDVLEAVSAS